VNRDLVVGLAVVAALLVTVAALAVEQASDDERFITFAVTDQDLGTQGPEAVEAVGLQLNWTLPRNATGAEFDVVVDFSGQAFQGGSATVLVEAYGPDGGLVGRKTFAFAIPTGATSASTNSTLVASWAKAPSNRTMDPGSLPVSRDWSQPVVLKVRVEPPADIPAATFTFQATVAGTSQVYAHQFG
jgi:hypothetical protein